MPKLEVTGDKDPERRLSAVITPQEVNLLRAAARCIHKAEKEHGPRTRNQKLDLLEDNFKWIRNRPHAERVLATVEDLYLRLVICEASAEAQKTYERH